jgi:predicted metal-dependent hydrolase
MKVLGIVGSPQGEQGRPHQVRVIRWVSNQNKRVGSCTPSKGTIRISHHVAEMPAFVRDYVIVHELAHLVEPNHSQGFWKLVTRYPRTERARGYLMAVGLEPLDE